jgi:hypothetical protein
MFDLMMNVHTRATDNTAYNIVYVKSQCQI